MTKVTFKLTQNELHLNAGKSTEATIQRCSLEKVFWKYVANLQENTHAEVRFQFSVSSMTYVITTMTINFRF